MIDLCQYDNKIKPYGIEKIYYILKGEGVDYQVYIVILNQYGRHGVVFIVYAICLC